MTGAQYRLPMATHPLSRSTVHDAPQSIYEIIPANLPICGDYQLTVRFCPVNSAERQALELILSENIIELQFTDNQILIKIQSKTKSF